MRIESSYDSMVAMDDVTTNFVANTSLKVHDEVLEELKKGGGFLAPAKSFEKGQSSLPNLILGCGDEHELKGAGAKGDGGVQV